MPFQKIGIFMRMDDYKICDYSFISQITPSKGYSSVSRNSSNLSINDEFGTAVTQVNEVCHIRLPKKYQF